jgi:type IV pilus assembly protein PilB
LVRVVCPHCSVDEPPTKSEQDIFKKHNIKVDKVKRARGCPICGQKGYKGRTALFEILDINENIIRLISNKAHEYEVLEQARKDGTRLLIESGLSKVKQGITTVEEILRISLD